MTDMKDQSSAYESLRKSSTNLLAVICQRHVGKSIQFRFFLVILYLSVRWHSGFVSESVEWSPEDCNFSRLLVLRSPNLFNEASYCFGSVTAPFYRRIATNLRTIPLDKDKFEFRLKTRLLEAGAPAKNTKRVLNGPLAVLTDGARSR